MANIDLSSMSVSQLRDLIKQAGAEIANKEKLKVKEARDKIAAIANEYGVMLDDILKRPSKAKGARAKAAPKYRNTKNAAQTWAGRGRKPAWLEAELKKGAKLESFLIK